MKIKPCRLSKQLDSVIENPFVFCGYKVSRVIGQNTHSRNIFSVHGFLNLSVIEKKSSQEYSVVIFVEGEKLNLGEKI